MRTTIVVVGVAVVFAGCLGAGGPGTVAETDRSPTPPGTPTPAGGTPTASSATPTACQEAVVTTVDPARDSVEPSTLPDRPATLNESSVAQFVVAYEEAYKRNVGLQENTATYEVDAWDPRVRAVDGGYVVNVTAVYWYNAADADHEGTGTPTMVHADGPEYTASYLVSADRLRRDTTLEDETLDPRSGTTVECWSD